MAYFIYSKGYDDVGLRVNMEFTTESANCGVDLSVFGLCHDQVGNPRLYGDGSHALTYANTGLLRYGKNMSVADVVKIGEKEDAVSRGLLVFDDAKIISTLDGTLLAENMGRKDQANITVFSLELFRLPAEIVEVAIFASIYFRKEDVGKNFSQVRACRLTMVDQRDRQPRVIDLKSLPQVFFDHTMIQVGSWLRRDEGWVFEEVGKGSKARLRDVIKVYSGK